MTDGIPDELVKVCPECDAANPAYNSGHVYGSRDLDAKRYRCRRCGETFDAPLKRKRRGTGARHGLAAKLEKADPDDVGSELVTDGGTKQTHVPDADLRAAIERVVQRRGPYFKAKDLATELDVSPHAAGQILADFEDVEKWGYSANATTWHYVASTPTSEALTDGGVLRRCGRCDTLNNVVVNDERCWSCGQSWVDRGGVTP